MRPNRNPATNRPCSHRETIAERLDEISAELVRDFDRQVQDSVESLRTAVVRRRKMFAADLYQQFDLVQSLGSDPAMLETHRRDAERFAEAFDACAGRARNAVAFSLAAACSAVPPGATHPPRSPSDGLRVDSVASPRPTGGPGTPHHAFGAGSRRL